MGASFRKITSVQGWILVSSEEILLSTLKTELWQQHLSVFLMLLGVNWAKMIQRPKYFPPSSILWV